MTFDLPAHGLTGPAPDGQYTQAAYARVVDAVVARLGLTRFVLGGNSMGGGVAARYAADHPERIAGLILIDASGAAYRRGDGDTPFVLRLARLPVIRDIAASITPRSLIAASLKGAVTVRSVVTPAMIDRYWELLRYPGNRVATIERFAQGYQAVPQADLARISAPVLILWGRDDHFIPLTAATWFSAALPHSQTIVYDAVGHLPMEEVPDRSAADVAAFLDGLPVTPREAAPAPDSAPSPPPPRH